MPLKAVFRESMRRLKTSRFVIRIWLNQTSTVSEERLKDLVNMIDKEPPTMLVERAVSLAESFFKEDEGIAAIEVLSAGTHNGIVSYYEWP